MTHAIGMLSLDELRQQAQRHEIDTILAVFTDHYGRFVGKRLDVDYFLDHALDHGIGACDYLLTVDMDMQVVPGYQFANWSTGFGDIKMTPDIDTLRIASWLEKTALVICDVAHDDNHELIQVAPRSILHHQIDRLTDLGFQAKAASELEYHLFQNSFRDAAAKQYHVLEPIGWHVEDYHVLQSSREEHFNGPARRHLKRSGIPVENSKGECGIGQHELNIRYCDILGMADRHCIFKQCLKEVADQIGMSISFMAKYATDEAGSSCHIHISLWKDNQNIFAGESDIFRWFLAGWMRHTPEMMVFYAPTVNSYKRYQDASWAPTRIAWSRDNRTAGFRVVGKGSHLRIECRIPGADCNPYLALAAALASGIDGIANKLEPPKHYDGDVYSDSKLPQIPTNLADAVALFRQSKFALNAFGQDVIDHYSHFFHAEQSAFESSVTDWERQRYFERI